MLCPVCNPNQSYPSVSSWFTCSEWKKRGGVSLWQTVFNSLLPKTVLLVCTLSHYLHSTATCTFLHTPIHLNCMLTCTLFFASATAAATKQFSSLTFLSIYLSICTFSASFPVQKCVKVQANTTQTKCQLKAPKGKFKGTQGSQIWPVLSF